MTFYVHDGRAHIDELLAVTLYVIATGKPPVRIERIRSEDALERAAHVTLESEDVFIDCGGRYAPELSLFDHHQDRALPSAAKLVFDHFFTEFDGTELADWVAWISLIDTNGPRVIEDEGIPKTFQRLTGTTQGILLKAFEKSPLQTVATFEVGLREVLAHESRVKQATVWLRDRYRLVRHVGLTLVSLIEPPPPDLSRAVKCAQDKIVEENDVSAIYGFVSEEPGVRNLFRTDPGHTRLDFTKAAPHETLFVHNNGFLLKFRPRDDMEWLTLVEQSVIG